SHPNTGTPAIRRTVRTLAILRLLGCTPGCSATKALPYSHTDLARHYIPRCVCRAKQNSDPVSALGAWTAGVRYYINVRAPVASSIQLVPCDAQGRRGRKPQRRRIYPRTVLADHFDPRIGPEPLSG